MAVIFIGNNQPCTTNDIITTGIELAIYVGDNKIMVKAKSDISMDYIEKSIDEIVSIYVDNLNKTMDVFVEPSEEDKKSMLVAELLSDKLNYSNEDRKCECCRCELSSLCMYKDKQQRLGVEKHGLKECFKLEECKFVLFDFVERHLEEYKAIVEKRRKNRYFVEHDLFLKLHIIDTDIVAVEHKIPYTSIECFCIVYDWGSSALFSFGKTLEETTNKAVEVTREMLKVKVVMAFEDIQDELEKLEQYPDTPTEVYMDSITDDFQDALEKLYRYNSDYGDYIDIITHGNSIERCVFNALFCLEHERIPEFVL
jgi:hypothetical protein